MDKLDEIVRRLSEVTDELLSLDESDFAPRFALETERDALRAQAAEFHERLDEARSTEKLKAELKARRGQLHEVEKMLVNRALQTGGGNGEAERAIGAHNGGTINDAMLKAQGAGSIEARIAEIKQELARR